MKRSEIMAKITEKNINKYIASLQKDFEYMDAPVRKESKQGIQFPQWVPIHLGIKSHERQPHRIQLVIWCGCLGCQCHRIDRQFPCTWLS